MVENFSFGLKTSFATVLSAICLIGGTAHGQVKAKSVAPSTAKSRSVLLAQNQVPQVSSASGQSSAQVSQNETQDKKWSLGLSVDYNMSSVKEEAVEQETSVDYSMTPSYSISKDLSVSALGSINQQRTGAKETLVADTVASLSYKGYAFSETTHLKHSLAALLPTSRKSQEEDRYKGGLRLSNGIKVGLGSLLDVTYTLGIQRNVHEFNVNQDGKANIQWQIRHQLDLALHLTDSFAINAWGRYTVGSTYENFSRYSFVTDVTAEYEVFKSFTVSAGVGNDGPALKNNGVDSNIAVYDEKSSTYHAGIGYTF